MCDAAQKWANYLAALNEFYYRPAKTLGQNLFCCPCSALVTDLTGKISDLAKAHQNKTFWTHQHLYEKDRDESRNKCRFDFSYIQDKK